MAGSVGAAAVPVAPAFEEAGDKVEQAKTLIGALNLLSRNLPLPPAVLRAVSSIHHDGDAAEEEEVAAVTEGDADKGGDEEMALVDGAGTGDTAAGGAAEGATLIEELEDAIFKHQRTPMFYSELAALKEGRFNASIQHWLAELEGLPSTRGEDMQMKCLLELYGLKKKQNKKSYKSRNEQKGSS